MTSKVIYDYPKTSCDCFECNDENLYCEMGKSTNFSVKNCEVPNLFNCKNRATFRNSMPNGDKGYDILNPNMVKGKYSYDFTKVNCPQNRDCPKTQFVSTDPRLVSPPHSGQVLSFSRPPFNSTPKSLDVSQDKSLDYYGQGYSNYSDINAGYYLYYVDKSIQDPFFSPNFTIPAKIEGELYKDPMGAMLPQYRRKPIRTTKHTDTKRNNYNGCLSWMEDSLEHREDIMSRQMDRRNKQRWSPRWTN